MSLQRSESSLNFQVQGLPDSLSVKVPEFKRKTGNNCFQDLQLHNEWQPQELCWNISFSVFRGVAWDGLEDKEEPMQRYWKIEQNRKNCAHEDSVASQFRHNQQSVSPSHIYFQRPQNLVGAKKTQKMRLY